MTGSAVPDSVADCRQNDAANVCSQVQQGEARAENCQRSFPGYITPLPSRLFLRPRQLQKTLTGSFL